MTVEFKEIEMASNLLYEAVQKVPEQIERLQKEISICEMEKNDILHLIELENCNASQGWTHFRDLQITLQQRRRLKDELASLNSFQDKMSVGRPMSEQAHTLHHLVKARTQVLKSRNYRPRVRQDLTERFKVCKKKELLKGV